MAFVLMLTIVLCGIALMLRGFVGRRVGESPVCQYCHSELDPSGVSDETDWSWRECPKCKRNLRNAVAIGVRRSRFRSLAFGILLFVSGAGLLDRAREFDQRGNSLWAFAPDWLLVRAASPTRQNVQQELTTRAESDTLSADAWETLLASARDLLTPSIYDENGKPTRVGTHMQRRGMLHGQCYAIALMHGRATQEDWEWYARRVSAPRLLTYARYDGSGQILSTIWMPSEWGLSYEGIEWDVEYETYALEGEWGRIEAYDSRIIDVDGPQSAERDFELRGRAELPAQAFFDTVLNVRVAHSNPTYPTIEYQTHLRRETTLLPQGEPLYEWVSGPDVDRAIAESFRLEFIGGTLPGRPMQLYARWAEPVEVPFRADLILVVDGEERRIGYCDWDYVEGLNSSPRVRLDYDPRPVYPEGRYSLLLRASGEPRGRTRPNTDRLWIGEIDLGQFPR